MARLVQKLGRKKSQNPFPVNLRLKEVYVAIKLEGGWGVNGLMAFSRFYFFVYLFILDPRMLKYDNLSIFEIGKPQKKFLIF